MHRCFALLAGISTWLAMAAAAPAQDALGEMADDDPPKREIGIGAGGGWVPHYPAAEQGGTIIGVLPYFIYRWERAGIGEGGLASGRAFESERLDLTLSIGGSLPARSRDNRAREGMPDLDVLGEIGPQLEITLAERPDIDSVTLKLPLRAVVSTDFSRLDYRGVVFKPRLAYTREDLFGSDFEATVGVGPIFASGLLMDYYYDVPPAFATPDRPAYESGGGYLGSTLSLRLGYDVTGRLRLVAGGRAGYYGGARNRNSPLFRDNTTYSAGAGLVWKIWISDRTVRR